MEPQSRWSLWPPWEQILPPWWSIEKMGQGNKGAGRFLDKPVSCRACHGEQDIAEYWNAFKEEQSIF